MAVTVAGLQFGPTGFELDLLYFAGLTTLGGSFSGAEVQYRFRPPGGGFATMSTMTEICIRLARPSDHGHLVRMREALWPDASAEEHARELTAILEGKPPVTLPLIILVAETSDARVVGFLEVDLRSHADGCNSAQPVGYLEGWYVEAEHRHRGIARKLLAAAEQWARSHGCVEMASDTWIDNEVSQRVHQALGYEVVDRCVHYRKTL